MDPRRAQLGGLQISNRLVKLMVEIESDFEIPVFRSSTYGSYGQIILF